MKVHYDSNTLSDENTTHSLSSNTFRYIGTYQYVWKAFMIWQLKVNFEVFWKSQILTHNGSRLHFKKSILTKNENLSF